MIQIIPVLDLLNQTVVRGVAGQRDEYRPIKSHLVKSSDPLKVANAFRDEYSFNEIYVADLDAIQFKNYQYSVIQELLDDGFELIVDAGVREIEQVKHLIHSGVQKLVAGMETIPGPDFLRQIGELVPYHQLIFSLDLLDNRPLCVWKDWKNIEPIHIIKECREIGLTNFIVLDLKQVGMGNGLNTLELCQNAKSISSDIKVITGGGIHQPADVETAQTMDVDGLLVSSSLHNGNLHDFLISKPI